MAKTYAEKEGSILGFMLLMFFICAGVYSLYGENPIFEEAGLAMMVEDGLPVEPTAFKAGRVIFIEGKETPHINLIYDIKNTRLRTTGSDVESGKFGRLLKVDREQVPTGGLYIKHYDTYNHPIISENRYAEHVAYDAYVVSYTEPVEYGSNFAKFLYELGVPAVVLTAIGVVLIWIPIVLGGIAAFICFCMVILHSARTQSS